MTYTLSNLPKHLQNIITETHTLQNTNNYRALFNERLKSNNGIGQLPLKNIDKKSVNDKNTPPQSEQDNDLFSLFSETMIPANITTENASNVAHEFIKINYHDTNPSKVIWGTDDYESRGTGYKFHDAIEDFSAIVPRIEKSATEQRRRAKSKAEVFTPAWVCNLSNNLIDSAIVGDTPFNTVSEDYKTWTPTSKPVTFAKGVSWLDYVSDRRMEITCGEGPYLMSRYDATNGNNIPIRDNNGNFLRIGLLDRKLRVVSENTTTVDDWRTAAMIAFNNTFGFEWQGDNLLLSRINFVNTFVDYFTDKFPDTPVYDEDILEIVEIASWNLWQMDGLKMVSPMSCSEDCVSCAKKLEFNHDGNLSIVRFPVSVDYSQNSMSHNSSQHSTDSVVNKTQYDLFVFEDLSVPIVT